MDSTHSDKKAGLKGTVVIMFLMAAAWFMVVLKLRVWKVTTIPSEGVWPSTFSGWAEYSIGRHMLLPQFAAVPFAQGTAYTNYTYPFILSNYLLVAPFHWAGLPYEVAQHCLAYFYVLCITALLIAQSKRQATDILQTRNLFLYAFLFVAVGITVTSPLPWICTLLYFADNFHLLAAASFCYLSVSVFRGEPGWSQLLIVGIFIALWSPIYLPAWILSGIFLNGSLKLERRRVSQAVGVIALGVFNLMLPKLACRLAGMKPGGSTYWFRSGLDGSTLYFSSIYQAAFFPSQPRHWPTLFYVLITAIVSLLFQRSLKKGTQLYPLRQAAFLLIPYATIAIIFPQFTSIHPYTTDQLLVIPATFALSFWFLQKTFWERLTSKTYVGWSLVAGLILMTNMLTVAQNMAGLYFRDFIVLVRAKLF